MEVAEKNDFNLLVGPTNDEGMASIGGVDVARQIEQIRSLFLMDYAGSESWTGLIRLAALNSSDVESAISAIEIWGASPGLDSLEDLALLRTFGDYLERHSGEELAGNAWAEPANAARLETATTLAWSLRRERTSRAPGPRGP
jgi:hypothetical protein